MVKINKCSLIKLVILLSFSMSFVIYPVRGQTLYQADIEAATNLMEKNGIPLSLFSQGKFETEIAYTNTPLVTGIGLKHKYNGIPISLWQEFSFLPDGTIYNFYDKDIKPEGDHMIYFFPKEMEEVLSQKGITKSVVLIDFASLPQSPTITKQQADSIMQKIIDSWHILPEHLPLLQNYTMQLEYWANDPRNPDFKLAWVYRLNGGSPTTVIDAQNGNVLMDWFDPRLMFSGDVAAYYESQKEASDKELAISLMEKNDVPLSLLNIENLRLEITRVVKSTVTRTGAEYSIEPNDLSVRFKQYYKNKPILPSELVLGFRDEKLYYAGGTILYPKDKIDQITGKGLDNVVMPLDLTNLPTTPEISKEQAEQIAKDKIINDKLVQGPSTQSVVFSAQLSYDFVPQANNEKKLALVWYVTSNPATANTVIDAQTGKILSVAPAVFFTQSPNQTDFKLYLYSAIVAVILIVIIVLILKKRSKPL